MCVLVMIIQFIKCTTVFAASCFPEFPSSPVMNDNGREQLHYVFNDDLTADGCCSC